MVKVGAYVLSEKWYVKEPLSLFAVWWQNLIEWEARMSSGKQYSTLYIEQSL